MIKISIATADLINLKLSQAYAINALLIDDCHSHGPLTADLRNNALWVVSDLIMETRKAFNGDFESKATK